jgi:hypothetical protein
MKVKIIFFTLFAIVCACPVWKCEELETGLCATWDEKSVRVNTKKCQNGKFCYLLGLELERNWRTHGNYSCEDFEMDMKTEAINCNVVKVGESYEQSHPIKCRKDSDCRLASGKGKSCVCGIDGNSYCELGEDDVEVFHYLANCPYLDQYQAYAWYLFMDLFPLLNGVPMCVANLFEDLGVIRRYYKMLQLRPDMFLD